MTGSQHKKHTKYRCAGNQTTINTRQENRGGEIIEANEIVEIEGKTDCGFNVKCIRTGVHIGNVWYSFVDQFKEK